MDRAARRDAPAPDGRPAYRPFAVEVARLTRLSPNFMRVTFAGPGLHWFATHRQDQRVKLLLPLEDGSVTDVGARDGGTILSGTWYERWRATPAERRSPLRTYTVRDVRPLDGEVDVDLVTHDDGAASRWLAHTRPGEEVVLIGPDARSRTSDAGRDWSPGAATELLLAGDETAAPAIGSILEALPAGRRARAFIEVPTAGDALPLDLPPRAEVTWMPREGGARGGLLVPAVHAWATAHPAVLARAAAPRRQELEDVDVDTALLWDSPVLRAGGTRDRAEQRSTGFYAWFAGEAAVIRTLRRILVSEFGVCRQRVAFMGYWRAGRAEAA